jgi:glyoxylase-like metal-dependent hydrolase (beta-lactamase superfamily II)
MIRHWLKQGPSPMPLHIGDIRIDRVIESEGPDFVAHELIPDATPAALAPHRSWLHPHYVDFDSGKLIMAMQTYVLRHGRSVILVDTCVGNHKARRFHAPWNQRTDTAWLDNLAAAGVRLEDVSHVMCTHLHPDHVGWNTRLIDGRWVPTFPNARYVFARTEWEHFERLYKKHGAKAGDGSIEDSVLPIVAAGRADLVSSEFALDGSLWLEPAPGHTPGHVAINLSSGGKKGVLT